MGWKELIYAGIAIVIIIAILISSLYFLSKQNIYPSPQGVIERTFPSSAYTNQEFQVNLNIIDDNTSQVIGISEQIPQGFKITSVSDDGVIKNNTIEWILVKNEELIPYLSGLSNKTLNYTLISSSEGTYNISGYFLQDNNSEQDIPGNSVIKIEANSPENPNENPSGDGDAVRKGSGGSSDIPQVNTTINNQTNQNNQITNQNNSQVITSQENKNQVNNLVKETPQSSNYLWIYIPIFVIVIIIIFIIYKKRRRR